VLNRWTYETGTCSFKTALKSVVKNTAAKASSDAATAQARGKQAPQRC
jgi:hypothetical protein